MVPSNFDKGGIVVVEFISQEGIPVRAALAQVLMCKEGVAICHCMGIDGRGSSSHSIVSGTGRRVYGTREGIRVGTRIESLPKDKSHILLALNSGGNPLFWVGFRNYEEARLVQSSYLS